MRIARIACWLWRNAGAPAGCYREYWEKVERAFSEGHEIAEPNGIGAAQGWPETESKRILQKARQSDPEEPDDSESETRWLG